MRSGLEWGRLRGGAVRRALQCLATDLRAALGSLQTDQMLSARLNPDGWLNATEPEKSSARRVSSFPNLISTEITVSGPSAGWLTSPRGVEGGKEKKKHRGRDRERALERERERRDAGLAVALRGWPPLTGSGSPGGDAAGRGWCTVSTRWRRRRCEPLLQHTRTAAVVFFDQELMMVMMLPPPVVLFCSSGSYSSGILVLRTLDYRWLLWT